MGTPVRVCVVGKLSREHTLEQFRNYYGLRRIARCGFPGKKTTKRPIVPVYTNCETALTAGQIFTQKTALANQIILISIEGAPRRATQDFFLTGGGRCS